MASTSSRTVWSSVDARHGETADAKRVRRELDPAGPDPLADEKKWPAWMVTLFVVVFCGLFWTGVGYAAMTLLD